MAARINHKINGKDSNGVIVDMSRPIIVLHGLGNPKPISLEVAATADITKEKFDKWCYYVEDLRQASIAYGRLYEAKDTHEKELAEARIAVWSKWEALCKAGVDHEAFIKRFFVRENDAETMRVYATNIKTVNVEGVGSVFTATHRDDFRRKIEILIGCRVAANGILGDKDRDLVLTYQGKIRTIQSCKDRLEGYTSGNNVVIGLLDQEKNQQKKIEEAEAMLRSIMPEAADETIESNPAFKALRATLDNIKTQIENTKKQRKDAERWLSDKKDTYKRLVDTLHAIDKTF